MTLRTLNYGNYGIFLKMGNAGFLSINRIARGLQGWQCGLEGFLLGEMQGGLMSPKRGLGVYCSIWVLEYHTLIPFWDLVLKLDHYDNSLNPKPSTNPKPFTFFSRWVTSKPRYTYSLYFFWLAKFSFLGS